MKHSNHKRTLAARLLLLVFLPTMVCLSLHIHQGVDDSEETCYECAHHMPHSGHLSMAKAALHDCLLCQLSHIPFDVPKVIAFVTEQHSHIALYLNPCPQTATGVQGFIFPRAPPV